MRLTECLQLKIGAARPRGYSTFLVTSSSQSRGTRRSEAGRSTGKPARSGGHASARSAALEQLLRIEEEGAFAGLVGGSPSVRRRSSRRPCRTDLDSRDAKFITELVSGVTRWRRRLDWLIRQLRPTGQIDVELQQILRMGVYELVQLGKPDHIINEHVDLARHYVRPDAARVANGVLRTLTRMRQANAVPSPGMAGTFGSSQADALGIASSHPTWMVERWLARLGEADTLELLAANNRQPSYSLRVNTMRISLQDLRSWLLDSAIETEPSPYLPNEFLQVISGLRDVMAQGLLTDGICQVQDESAGMVVALLDPQPGEDVLDACAAPGGKTLFAAARMRGQGRLLALDANERRLRGLAAIAQGQGVPDGFLRVQTADLRAFAHEQASTSGRVGQQQGTAYDRVLLDVPCSGLGVLSKRADLRWRRSPADVAAISALQDELMHAASQLVKPGGLLVYSTCSIEPEENELRVQHFLEGHPNFIAEACPAGLLPDGVLTEQGFFASHPHKHAMDGAFAARLRNVT